MLFLSQSLDIHFLDIFIQNVTAALNTAILVQEEGELEQKSLKKQIHQLTLKVVGKNNFFYSR